MRNKQNKTHIAKETIQVDMCFIKKSRFTEHKSTKVEINKCRQVF